MTLKEKFIEIIEKWEGKRKEIETKIEKWK